MNKALTIEVVKLRSQGLTYSEIQNKLKTKIPKSTLAYMCRSVVLNQEQKVRIRNKINESLVEGRQVALSLVKARTQEKTKWLLQKNLYLGKIIQRTDVAKIALAMLFLGEGSKAHKFTVMFGNSNPEIIVLFLKFFRQCYLLEESKFRCTVQCRVGQNSEELKKYWSKITKIPLSQFYKTQVDPRTKGKPLRHLNYKGVCRLDYLSSELVCDLQQTIKALSI